MIERKRGERRLADRLARKKSDLIKGWVVELQIFGKGAEDFYARAVEKWRESPTFNTRVTRRGTMWRVFVSPDESEIGQIWIWVNYGTGQWGATGGYYPIEPIGEGYPLRFQRGYNARTGPGGQFDVGNGRKFGPWVEKFRVDHPGIEERRFDKRYIDENTRDFMAALRAVIARVNRK